jgi:ferredoxin-NADP reductase
MPGATLVTVITVDAAFLTAGAMDLELVGAEQLSPYNPKPRGLATETPVDRSAVDVKARLVEITAESSRVSTFTFALSEPAAVVPGGYAVFDFSDHVTRWYQHMNARDPQSLNDDYVRTFTVSKLSRDGLRLSITVKKSGVISSYLHALKPGAAVKDFRIQGFGGSFTCFEQGRALPHMLWVAAGVGVTPFLAMYRALRASGEPMPEVELWYACRGDEVALVRELTDVRVRVFDATAQTETPPDTLRAVHRRRLREDDFESAPVLRRATVFVCGPEGFMADVTAWLARRVDASRVRVERFSF